MILHNYKFYLERVIDGDTFAGTIDLGFHMFYNCKVRVYGINAPELKDQKGEAAKKRLEELLKQGLIILHSLEKPEKFGRVLANVYVNGDVNVAELMIQEGHGVAYYG